MPLNPERDVLLALKLLASMAFILYLSIAIAWRAYQRGYSFLFWMLVTLVSTSPLPIVVLAFLPNRWQEQERQLERDTLERQLAAARSKNRQQIPSSDATGANVTASTGDLPTAD